MAARAAARPRFHVLPEPGERVCLIGCMDWSDKHTHGTVLDVREDGDRVVAAVQWDDEPGADFELCPIGALDRRCDAREERTPALPIRSFDDRFPER